MMDLMIRYVQFAAWVAWFTVFAIIVKILSIIAPSYVRKKVDGFLTNFGCESVNRDDFLLSIQNGTALPGLFRKYRDNMLYRQSKVGQKAPNPPVLELDGVTQRNLLDLTRGSRPLVVNFGSCS